MRTIKRHHWTLGLGAVAGMVLGAGLFAAIEGIEANQEFQRNVRLIQSQRQRAIQLAQQIEQADDEAERSRLETERDVMIDRLNDNNRRMIEAYGFSLTRNYVMMVEKSHIYLAVSEEEAERYRALREQQQQQQLPVGEPADPVAPADD